MRLFLFLALVPSLLCAQHGYAPSGMYPSNYSMHTYTGRLLDYHPDTHEIRVQCDICVNKEEFTAILGDPEASKVMQFKRSPRDSVHARPDFYVRQPAPDEITIGDLLRLYYNERKRKQEGRTVKYNAVFAMERMASATPPPPDTQKIEP